MQDIGGRGCTGNRITEIPTIFSEITVLPEDFSPNTDTETLFHILL